MGNGEKELLTLPGTYIFVIADRVGKNLDDDGKVEDYNEFTFGIKLLNNAPQTEVYTYTGYNKTDKVYYFLTVLGR